MSFINFSATIVLLTGGAYPDYTARWLVPKFTHR
jgi:hypothetical protein